MWVQGSRDAKGAVPYTALGAAEHHETSLLQVRRWFDNETPVFHFCSAMSGSICLPIKALLYP